MDFGEKDQFLLAGVVFGHYNMAKKMGLVIDVGTEYQLDPDFEKEITNKVIGSTSACEAPNSLICEIVVESL